MSRLRRYVFNPLTLSYEIKKDSRLTGLIKSLIFLAITLLVTILILVIQVALGYDLPKTAILRKKNAKLTSKVALLNRQLEQHNENLYALQVRDDGIYRSIFGMNAIPDEVRNSGFSGINRYSEYDGSLKDVAQKLDRLMKKTYIQSKSFDEVSLLSKRMEAAENIGRIKRDNDVRILQSLRWESIAERTLARSASLGLSIEFLQTLLDAIHVESINHQNKVMKE